MPTRDTQEEEGLEPARTDADAGEAPGQGPEWEAFHKRSYEAGKAVREAAQDGAAAAQAAGDKLAEVGAAAGAKAAEVGKELAADAKESATALAGMLAVASDPLLAKGREVATAAGEHAKQLAAEGAVRVADAAVSGATAGTGLTITLDTGRRARAMEA